MNLPNRPESRSVKVAIIGSGPAGFFCAEELLSHSDLAIQVDLFDRLPTPFGLVRGGVAPDHQKVKTVSKVFEKTAARQGFSFYGKIELGRDLSIEDFLKHYDAVVLAVGAKSDRRMDIPGEDLSGSYPGTAFVGWFNGHPDYQGFKFDLSCERVAVIGNGNVALNVTRVLGTDPSLLHPTDITEQAMNALKASKIREIYVLGRRGPLQASFTNPEIWEMAHVQGADFVVPAEEVDLDELSRQALPGAEPTAQKNVEFLVEQSKKPPAGQAKKIVLRFLVSPLEIIGENGRVTGLKLEKNRLYKAEDGTLRPRGTGQIETLPAGLVFRTVGYKGVAIPGVPFNDRTGTIPNQSGRVIDPSSKSALPDLYVVGWAKRGPSGMIGKNKPCSIETARLLLSDLKEKKRTSPLPAITDFLKQKNIGYVTFSNWKHLDYLEIEKGKVKGKVRLKFTTIVEMLSALENLSRSSAESARSKDKQEDAV